MPSTSVSHLYKHLTTGIVESTYIIDTIKYFYSKDIRHLMKHIKIFAIRM